MQRRDSNLAGLDVVRLVALCLVTAQHAFTLLDREEWTTVASLWIGQIGVALFLAVSGLLAIESRRPPVPWLLQRLRRLFPAYWIVIAASFFLTWMIGHKHFDVAQVLAQMLGVGLFTHPAGNLVNSPTWFVSLLLVCYLGTFAGRLLRAPVAVGVGVSVVVTYLVWVEPHPWLLSHFLTYALASSVAQVPRRHRTSIALLLAGVLVAMAYWRQPAFGYTALALIAIELAFCLRQIPRVIRVAAGYSYEYFLVHGVALFGMIRLLPSHPALAVGSAIVMSAATAVVLHRIVAKLDHIVTEALVARPGTVSGGAADSPATHGVPVNRS